MERIGKRVIAVLAALALAFSAFSVDFTAVEVKADAPSREVSVVEGQDHAIFNAKLYYHFTQNDNMTPVDGDWNDRYDACVTWAKAHNPVLHGENDWNWHEDDTPQGYRWDWKDNDESTFDDIFILIPMHNWDDKTITHRLVVASSGAISVDNEPDQGGVHGEWSSMEVRDSAEIGGPVAFCSPEENAIFKLDDGATLTFVDNGSFKSDKAGLLRVGKKAKIVKIDGTNLTVTIDGQSVTFDGQNNTLEYDLYCDDGGNWSGEAAPHIIEEVVLPRDEKSFNYTLRDYWDNLTGRKEFEYNEDGTIKKDDNGNDCQLPPHFTKITIAGEATLCDGIRIDELVVNQGATLTMTKGSGTNDQGQTDYWNCSLDVQKATINGTVVIENADLGGESWQVNHLVIYDELNIGTNGSVDPQGDAQFELDWNKPVDISVSSMSQLTGLCRDDEKGVIYVYPGQKINVGGSAYRAPIGTTGVLIDGNQEACKLRYDVDSSRWIGIGRVQDLTLPADKESYQFTIDWYYGENGIHKEYVEHDYDGDGEIDEDNGEWREELPPAFGTITIDGTFPLDQSIRAEKLIVNNGADLTFTTGNSDPYEYEWKGVRVKDSNGAPIMVTDYWAGQLVVDEAEIAGTVKILNSTAEWKERDEKGDVVDSGPAVNYLQVNKKLTITGNGSLETVGNGELSFGEFDEASPQTIVVPKTSAIKSERFWINPFTKISVDGDYFVLNNVKSGNPGDEAVHDGFVLDGSLGNWVVLASQDDGSWALADDSEIWWGAPFDNEYRVYADDTVVLKDASGKTFASTDFNRFVEGQAIEFEIVPPAGYTGTPIVLVNGGIYYDGDNVCRSDDYLASDSWINGTVKKISVTNNRVTYTPDSNESIAFNVYLEPEQIIEEALFSLDRRYLWSGEFDKDTGEWFYYAENAYNPNDSRSYNSYGLEAAWADPANEFIVEVTQNNSNGTVEMTPGIDFYRLGNKVKALYQGFEILGDNAVEIKFKPASGYDLLSVTIDGTSYSPLAVSGMTYSGGVYTLKITDTPTKNSTLRGMYADDFNRDYVKIKTIAANFGIQYYSNPDPDPTPATPDPTPATPATPATPEPEPEVIKEPEVVDTINRVTKSEDGTETTTNITKYDDGSQTTEKIVEKPDGSSTATTTTKEADGTTVTEKVEKKADGTEVTTNTVKETDGSSTTEKVEKKNDGTVTTTNTVKDADGATTTEKVVEKPDGSVTTTSTEKDADGNVLTTSKVVEKTKEDGTKTITATEKNADGSSSTSKTTLNTDGSSKISTTTQNADGSTSVSKTTIKADGSSKTNTETQNADGSTTTEKITEKADGSLSRTATTVDDDGNVLSKETEKVTVSKSGTTTGTTIVENADGSSSESVVKTKTDGSVSSTTTETDAEGNVSVTLGTTTAKGTETTKSFAVEEDGVSLTKLETEGTTATIPATIKANGETIPVTSVGDGAMKGNETVKTVKLADTITSIGEGAFDGAKNLKTIKLSANITEIAPDAFKGINSKATFYITAASDEEFDALVELLKKSGVGSKVKFKRA